MSEIIIDFIYEGKPISVLCRENELMKEVINKFCIKAKSKRNSIYCLFSGNKLDENKKVKELISQSKGEKISLLVYQANEDGQGKIESIVKSTQAICPECGEIALISFKNYKISIECKNNHTKENIVLDEFEKTQKIDESKIICQECKKMNKSMSFNKEFYICLICKKSLCPLCKSNHNKNHNTIKYDQQNYICLEHGENFGLFCKDCKKNLCPGCENEHSLHDIITLGKLFPNKNELNKKMEELKKNIDKMKNEIKNIINILNKINDYMDKFYNINNNINNYFDIKTKNYEILCNIKEINNNNIINDINSVIKEKSICDKFINLFNIYNMMFSKDKSTMNKTKKLIFNNIRNNNRRNNIYKKKMINSINNNISFQKDLSFDDFSDNSYKIDTDITNSINNQSIINNLVQVQNNNETFKRNHYIIRNKKEYIRPLIIQESTLIDKRETEEIYNIIQQIYTYKFSNNKNDHEYLSEMISQKIKQKINGEWLVFISDSDKNIHLGFSTVSNSDFLIIDLDKTRFRIMKLK